MEDLKNVHKVLGELLAEGLTSEEVILQLLERYEGLEKSAAIAYLNHFYETWSETDESLSKQVDLNKYWHVFMRHKLLQTALKESSTKDLRTTLAILDSLASIQGVTAKLLEETEIPIHITLVPVQLPSGKENTKSESLPKEN